MGNENNFDLYNFMKSSEFITSGELHNQQEVNEAYDALIQTASEELGATYLYDFPTKFGSIDRNDILDFIRTNIRTDRLQKENILLSSKMRYALLACPKEMLYIGSYQRSIDPVHRRFNYSYLSRGRVTIPDKNHAGKTRTVFVYFLNTMQFELEKKNSSKANNMLKEQFRLFAKLMEYGDPANIDEVEFLAEKAENFSVHQYYLPYGLEHGSIKDGVLLYRYDHDSRKHINYNLNNNGTMPQFYTMVYPDHVEAPHFHFPTTMGNLYKLSAKNALHNYGVGYALDVNQLQTYLNNLLYSNTKYFQENDFEMPFLKIAQSGASGSMEMDKLQAKLKKLISAINSNDHKEELFASIDFLNGATHMEKFEVFDEFDADRFKSLMNKLETNDLREDE